MSDARWVGRGLSTTALMTLIAVVQTACQGDPIVFCDQKHPLDAVAWCNVYMDSGDRNSPIPDYDHIQGCTDNIAGCKVCYSKAKYGSAQEVCKAWCVANRWSSHWANGCDYFAKENTNIGVHNGDTDALSCINGGALPSADDNVGRCGDEPATGASSDQLTVRTSYPGDVLMNVDSTRSTIKAVATQSKGSGSKDYGVSRGRIAVANAPQGYVVTELFIGSPNGDISNANLEMLGQIPITVGTTDMREATFELSGTYNGQFVTMIFVASSPLKITFDPVQALFHLSGKIKTVTVNTTLELELDFWGIFDDQDGDGVPDVVDNCKTVRNPDQAPDTTAPTFTSKPSDIRTALCGSPIDLGTAVVVDNCSSRYETKTSNDAPSTFPLGNTVVTWTATDGAGNVGTYEQTVTIAGSPKFTATPADIHLEACDPAPTSIGTATAVDVCGAAVAVTNDAPAKYPVGTTKVTWKATDAMGSTSTHVQYVTVSATDLGAEHSISSVANNACLEVSAYPNWSEYMHTIVLQPQGTGDQWPIPTRFKNCTSNTGSGSLNGPWQQWTTQPIDNRCPTFIKLQGNGEGVVTLTWWGNG